MRLPQIPRHVQPKERSAVVLGGINYSDNYREGELAESSNLSTRRYPYLTQRPLHTSVGSFTDAQAGFSWDGHMVIAQGGKLYYDGKAIANVDSRPKQFAVVNTKLIVWPDKLIVDITGAEVRTMDAAMPGAAGAKITGDTIEISATPRSMQNVLLIRYRTRGDGYYPWINTYGTDVSKIGWTASGGWSLPAPVVKSPSKETLNKSIIIPYVTTDSSTGNLVFSDPNSVWAKTAPSSVPTTEQNNMGYYAIIDGTEVEIGSSALRELVVNVFQVGSSTPIATEYFHTGDYVEISGSAIKANNKEHIRIDGIRDGEAPTYQNTLTFAEGSFLSPTAYRNLTSKLTQGTRYRANVKTSNRGDSSDYYTFTGDSSLPIGTQLLIFRSSFKWQGMSYNPGVYYFKPGANELGFMSNNTGGSGTVATFTYYNNDWTEYPEDEAPIPHTYWEPKSLTVKVPLPDLDFICEKDNRLWGVANSQTSRTWNTDTENYDEQTSRVIYASALGNPGQFWAFDGLSTDSWQVAVASEGDFTGMAAYSSGVLFFKEREVVKVIGRYPAEYTSYTYQFSGVKAGCSKTIRNINEVLYYLSPGGVMAYSGGVPQLVSAVFGNKVYSEGVAGADSRYYVLSADDSDGTHDLMVYDTQVGQWLRESNDAAEDFFVHDGSIHMVAGGSVYRMWADPNGSVSWMAQFCPMYENAHGKKRYGNIYLRLELDGSCKVETRADYGEWKTEKEFSAGRTVTVPLVPKRCDRFEIRLSGTGRCTVLSCVREFQTRSDA